MQHATLNQLSITKQIFLNIYNFPSALVSLKYHFPQLPFKYWSGPVKYCFNYVSID